MGKKHTGLYAKVNLKYQIFCPFYEKRKDSLGCKMSYCTPKNNNNDIYKIIIHNTYNI